jgi:hypothetical protein
MNTARILVRHHAELITEAADCEAAEARRRRTGDIEAAEVMADRAAELRERAAALADVLGRFDDVHVPDSRQLSLLADGGRQ